MCRLRAVDGGAKFEVESTPYIYICQKPTVVFSE